MTGERTRLLLFVLVGAFASAVNLGARILIDRVTSYEIAIVLAFPIALTTAFLLNRAFIFKPIGDAWRAQFLRFLLVNLAALVQVFAISVVLARFVFPLVGVRYHAETIAHGIGLLSPILTSYYAHKRFTFAADRRADMPETQP